MKSEHIYKSHNKTLLLYHLVFPAKYRKKVFNDEIDKTLKETCLVLECEIFSPMVFSEKLYFSIAYL